MTENAFAVHPYLIYAGISFFFLFLLVMLGAILRVSFQVGKIDGRLSGLETAVAELRQDNASIRQEMNALREQVAEIRGMLRASHDRIDLVMRHRHDETGAIVLTPTEPAPVAD
ncbi:MAG: hypothetical protein OXI54_10560 [Chloroflexota bacterium]|nr:hypothetical protein [Chloroflexota bacterium]MDE2684572.1 hypothetical protein [Chloroflexota bacterium]